MPLALFGITNDGLNLAVNLLVLFLVVVWLALIAWTYLDARRRLEDPVLIACATGAALFPFVGSVVYSILRPPEYLEDVRERALEIRASEMRLRQLVEASCPNCRFPIERTYLRCPNCKSRVKDPCEECGKPIDPRWAVCPYCETPVRRAAPQAAQRAAAAPRPAAKARAAARKPRTATPAGTTQTRKANAARPAAARASRPAQPREAAKDRPARPSR